MKRHTAEEIIPKRRQAEADLAQGLTSPRSANASPSASKRCTADATPTADFRHDRTSDGRPWKGLTLIDAYRRACLALEGDRGMTAQAVTAVLAAVVRERDAPVPLRRDNGSEFLAGAIGAGMAAAGLERLYLAPGASWENG